MDSAPAAERDARSKALVRKVAVELRTDMEKEALGQRRVVVTDFFADAAKILKLSQRPKLKNFQTRYLSAWNRETLLELRRQLDLIIGSREPTKRP